MSGGATVAKPTDDNRLDGVGRALLVAVSVSRAKMVGFFLVWTQFKRLSVSHRCARACVVCVCCVRARSHLSWDSGL